MIEYSSDPRPGDICVQIANIIKNTDPKTVKLTVNDEHGHIQLPLDMPRETFEEQFAELEHSPGTWVKKVRFIEFNNGLMTFIRLNAKGKEMGTSSVSAKIFRKTYILEGLSGINPPAGKNNYEGYGSQDPKPDLEIEEDEIVDLDDEIIDDDVT